VADPDIGLVLRKTNLSQLPQTKLALEKGSEESGALVARNLAGEEVLTAYGSIESVGWKVFVEQPVSEVYETLNATIVRTISLILAGLLISALVAMWLARSMVRPIRTLQEGAARIGAGDLEQRIEIKTGDELEALAEQFNQMSVQLRESYAGLERKVEDRTQELKRSLQHQTAISEVLRVISSSPSNVQPVLEAVAERAALLCDAPNATVFLQEGENLRLVANFSRTQGEGSKPDGMISIPARRTLVNGRAFLESRTVHVDDIVPLLESEYPDAREHYGRFGNRANLAVPMIREGQAVGTVHVWRNEPGLFSKDQVALLETFAAQAVIAIENARLFNETKEALERQTATAEVLRVISGSPTDMQPVFDAIVYSCLSLFGGSRVVLGLARENHIELCATASARPDIVGNRELPLDKTSGIGKCILESRTFHIPDTEKVADEFPLTSELAKNLGYRSGLFVPLMREGGAIGAITALRPAPSAFTDKEIELLKTFADQAVIAIENVRLFHEIQDKSRQLEIANQHKSDFLANMSHELRTPLNAIIGFSEVLVEKMFGEVNDKQLDYLKDIHSSGRHLLSLINDILDLSKIEAGRMELDIADFDLRSALENAMTLVKERAQRNGITLNLEVDPSLGMFRGDERKFKQILLNLLSNAVKFTSEGGKVGVAARPVVNAVEFSVTDTGVGISAGDQELVFEEFRQVGNDYTRKAEGTGLGLALTKRFVELHGGTIRLESAPGKGSTFTFTIPLGL
jgi:signal transduction histidine kinase